MSSSETTSLSEKIARILESEVEKVSDPAKLAFSIDKIESRLTNIERLLTKFVYKISETPISVIEKEKKLVNKEVVEAIPLDQPPLPKIKEPMTITKLRLNGKPKSENHGNAKRQLTEKEFRSLPLFKAMTINDIPMGDDKLRDFINMLMEETCKSYNCARQEFCRVLTLYGTGLHNGKNLYAWLRGYSYATYGATAKLQLKTYLRNVVLKANNEL